MALKPLSNLFVALILIGCSFEKKEEINYEAEFNAIVSEFEQSSILDFKKEEIDTNTFIEKFILKLDKQKNVYLLEDISKIQESSTEENKVSYQLLREVVDLYYSRYEESLKLRRHYLNNYEFDYQKYHYYYNY